MICRTAWIIAAILVFFTGDLASSLAQKDSQTKPTARIQKDKPTTYITFEHLGFRKPEYVNESDKGVWLRVHNNSQWSIFFRAHGVSKNRGDVGLFYEIESTGKRPCNEIPVPYASDHLSSVFELPSGKSATFSVPREHLADDLAIRVRFYYEWEGEYSISRGDDAQHYVLFRGSGIPK